MFEHFGIMDLFYGFKKNRIIFSLVFFVSFCLIISNFWVKNVVNENRRVYISSVNYCVEPSDYMLEASDPSIYASLPDSYVSMLNSDLCKKYLFDHLVSKYSENYIVENSGLGISQSALSESSVVELYSAKKSSMTIEVASITYSKDLSESVRDICHSFITDVASKHVNSSSIEIAGKVDKNLDKLDTKIENLEEDKRAIVKNANARKSFRLSTLIKKIIAPMVLVFVICSFIIIAKGAFYPTMNRFSDFSEYGIPVIGEVKNLTKCKGIKDDIQ